MIELKRNFTKRGVKLTQIFRDKEFAIYKASQDDVDSYWYEVFKITLHKPDKYHNEDFELYPYDEAFGLFAWCCSTESSVAKVIFNNFPNHRFVKSILNYTDGSYTVNGVEKPYFKLSFQDLKSIIES